MAPCWVRSERIVPVLELLPLDRRLKCVESWELEREGRLCFQDKVYEGYRKVYMLRL
jgi:hypothetical protein